MTFFIDNCLPPAWAYALDILFGPEGHHFVALRQKFKENTPDTIWIPMLATEVTEWIVITEDETLAHRSHELAAWQKSGLPVFFLKGWDRYVLHDRHAAIVRRVPEFVQMIRTRGKALGFRVPFHGRITPVYQQLPH